MLMVMDVVALDVCRLMGYCLVCGESRPESDFRTTARRFTECSSCRSARCSRIRKASIEYVTSDRACPGCGVVHRAADLYKGRCKPCRNRYHREYQRRTGHSKKEYHSRKKNPASYIYRNVKNRAHYNKIPFDLTPADIVIPTHCPILGFELTAPGSGQCGRSPSVDRLIPELGYVRGNIAIISLKANQLKNNATAAELERIA